jgi:hypothetical protein
VAEAITFEGRGKPVAAFALDTFARSICRAMATVHGFPDYPLVEIPSPFLENDVISQTEIEGQTRTAIAAAETLLFGHPVASAPAGSVHPFASR